MNESQIRRSPPQPLAQTISSSSTLSTGTTVFLSRERERESLSHTVRPSSKHTLLTSEAKVVLRLLLPLWRRRLCAADRAVVVPNTRRDSSGEMQFFFSSLSCSTHHRCCPPTTQHTEPSVDRHAPWWRATRKRCHLKSHSNHVQRCFFY